MSSNITVNGEPLEVILDKQTREEIKSLRESETRIKLNRGIPTKHPGNHSKSRSGRVYEPYMGDPKSTHVLAVGIFSPISDKAPFVRSGASVLGGVEYCSSTEEFKCHECGQWFNNLGKHCQPSHKKHFREYKLNHGLSLSRGISSPRQHAKRSSQARAIISRGSTGFGRPDKDLVSSNLEKANLVRNTIGAAGGVTPEVSNLIGKCRAQTENDGKSLYRSLDRTPRLIDLNSYQNKNGQKSLEVTRLMRMYGSVANFFLVCGIPFKLERRRSLAPKSKLYLKFIAKENNNATPVCK